jgi:hypothetical protein
MILSKEEIYKKKNLIKKIEGNIVNDTKSLFRLKIPGNYFLYETIVDGNLSYPKLGIYIDSYVVDMALEIEWIDVRRTWEQNVKYSYEFNNKSYTNYADEIRSELKSLIQWNDDMIVYGIWDTKPNWKQLRQSYERTIWFKKTKSELRNLQINRLLS